MDQTRNVADARQKAVALDQFLCRYPEVRCVVTGRPYSILEFKTELFSDGDWRFTQLCEFTPEQQKAYVGERLEYLKRLEADLHSQPRMLEKVRQLAPEELDGIRTAAELHWKVLAIHYPTPRRKTRRRST